MIELGDIHFIGKALAGRAVGTRTTHRNASRSTRAGRWVRPTEKARYYDTLARIRPELDYRYIPRFHGFVETNLGRGGVFDLITDEGTGELSKLFARCIGDGLVSADDPRWIAAHREFLERLFDDCIIVRDLHVLNFCAREMLDGSLRLVAIDGIGQRDFIPLCNFWKWAARRKLRRQIERKRFGSLEEILGRFHRVKERRSLRENPVE